MIPGANGDLPGPVEIAEPEQHVTGVHVEPAGPLVDRDLRLPDLSDVRGGAVVDIDLPRSRQIRIAEWSLGGAGHVEIRRVLPDRLVQETPILVGIDRCGPGGLLSVQTLRLGGPVRHGGVTEDAARIAEVVEVKHGHFGEDGLQVRRGGRSGHELSGAGIGDAVHADASTAPRLCGEPLGDVIGVEALHGWIGIDPRAERGSRSSHFGDGKDIPIGQELLHRMILSIQLRLDRAVRRRRGPLIAPVLPDHRQGSGVEHALARGPEQIDGDPDSVAHRDILRGSRPSVELRRRIPFVWPGCGNACLRAPTPAATQQMTQSAITVREGRIPAGPVPVIFDGPTSFAMMVPCSCLRSIEIPRHGIVVAACATILPPDR